MRSAPRAHRGGGRRGGGRRARLPDAGRCIPAALGALGGALVGGLIGNAAERVADDTTAFEYIVRKGNEDLLSVTEKDKMPLALGRRCW